MSSESKSIVCLISGRGSNLEALLRTARDQGWGADRPPHGAFGVAAVVSNRADAPGLRGARAYGVPATGLPHQDFPSREAFEAAPADAIGPHPPALRALAGVLRGLAPS